MKSPKLLTVKTLGGLKEFSLSALVDETVQLLTHVWLADAEYDTTIVEGIIPLNAHARKMLGAAAQDLSKETLKRLKYCSGPQFFITIQNFASVILPCQATQFTLILLLPFFFKGANLCPISGI